MEFNVSLGYYIYVIDKERKGTITIFWPIYKDNHLYAKKISFDDN